MVKIVEQDIPAELLDAYKQSLRQSTLWKGKDTPVFGVPKFGVLPFGVNTKILTARTRQPFRLPHMQSDSLHSPSAAQLQVRKAFKKCIDCFNGSPQTGGAVPPEVGYRSREWWYNQAAGSGMWYFNYFLSLTWWFFYDDCIPDWCGLCIPLDHIKDPYFKEDESDWVYGWDAGWDAIWDLYQAASWVDYPFGMDFLIADGTAYRSGSNTYMGSISCDKGTLVFKPCEHVSEYTWLNVETIKVQFKTQFYGTPWATARIRCIETGEVQSQASGQTIFYIPSDYWHYDEMTLTFEVYAENKPDLRPPKPWPYQVQTTGYQNYICDAALYCVGKGIY